MIIITYPTKEELEKVTQETIKRFNKAIHNLAKR